MNRRDERFFMRKKLLIHPQFQLTLMALNWVVITFVFAVLRVQSSRVFSDMDPLINMSKVSGDFATHYIEYQADRFNNDLLLFYVFAMIASGALTLIVSYRFAGPLVRLKGYFRDLGQAGAPVHDLNFRTGDYFSDLPPLVNTAIHRINGKPADSATPKKAG